MVSKSPPNTLQHHDRNNMTTDCTLETDAVGKHFILANRQCFLPLMTLLVHNYLVRSMACNNQLISSSLTQCIFFLSYFLYPSFLCGSRHEQMPNSLFHVVLVSIFKSSNFSTRILRQNNSKLAGYAQKSESLFMYHY
jgi:hypothetical protein